MVRTKRLEFVAKETRDLVLNVRKECLKSNMSKCLKDMEDLIVVGYRCVILHLQFHKKKPRK